MRVELLKLTVCGQCVEGSGYKMDFEARDGLLALHKCRLTDDEICCYCVVASHSKGVQSEETTKGSTTVWALRRDKINFYKDNLYNTLH